MELTQAQGRVLGALVEKERTTPLGYPLTDNALVAACNQTTSRDPVVAYDVATVRIAVRELRELGLLRTVHRSGERSDKHRHELEAALGLSPAQAALLALLLLRGPQTLAELRARSERLHPFATVDEVERELVVLADRDEPLVGLLARQPGRKEARFEQLLARTSPSTAGRSSVGPVPSEESWQRSGGAAGAGGPVGLPRAVEPVGAGAGAAEGPGGATDGAVSTPAASVEVAELRIELAELRGEVVELRAELAELRVEAAELAADLRESRRRADHSD